jgi:hypothetical protein
MEDVPGTFCLLLHAAYQCQHAGVCCSTDWLIPAEPQVLQIVTARGIRALDGSSRLFVPDPNGLDPVVARRPDGTCIFFNRDGRRLCIIHGVAGLDALPSACRHFPREILQDPRGSFISLSHFCPTAAALLLDADSALALAIVEAAPPLAIDGPIEGMDALASLPPLLRPGVLSDLAGYDAWERASLATLARPGVGYRAALRAVAAATDDIREWRPGDESLADRVARAFDRDDGPSFRLQAEDAPLAANAPWFRLVAARHFPASAAPVPEFNEVWSRLVMPSLPSIDHAIRNYLAARLFGNWIVYQGRGWRTVVAWVCTAAGVLENELARRCSTSGLPPTRDDFIAAVGATDLLLLHSIDSEHLASHFAAAEGPEPR